MLLICTAPGLSAGFQSGGLIPSGLRCRRSHAPRTKSWETFATGSFWPVTMATPQNKEMRL